VNKVLHSRSVDFEDGSDKEEGRVMAKIREDEEDPKESVCL